MVELTQADVLGRPTLRRLGRAVRDFFASEVGGRATTAAALLLALLVGINALNVVNSYVGRDFMTAIEHRDPDGFLRMAVVYVAVFAASTVAAVIHRFTEERLGLLWRDWLTRRLLGAYLEGRTYYRMEMDGELANPDQRIADDVRSFTTTTLSLFLIFVNGTFTLAAFSGVLWSISRLLFVVAVAYAALGSLLAVVLGRPLVRLNYDQADREAGLRTTLVGVRALGESIAIVRAEPRVLAALGRRVDAITANLKRIIAVNRNLSFFTTGYNYMIQLIPPLIVAPMFIRGTVEFGVIPQSSMAFAQVMGAFSLIVNQFPMLSSYAAILARLQALVNATEAAAARPPSGPAAIDDDRQLAFEDVTLLAPQDGRPLVRSLSTALAPGGRLLVTGPSDATGALQRAVAGMWEAGSGRVRRPPGDGVCVLAERPFVPPVTVRQLIGADGASRVRDDDVWAALRAVSVDAVVRRAGGLDVELDREALSPDEQRLVELARVLLVVPRFALVGRLEDDVGAERAAQVLGALAARGIGYVVLGDVTLAREHFDAVVAIAPDGTWTRTPIREEERA